MESSAQNPNWSEDIAPIFYQHCTACHHTDGAAGPISLMTYLDALIWVNDLVPIIQTGIHPPRWPADPNYRHYLDENLHFLSPNEIDLITQWVDSGAPEGNPNLAPPPPVYSSVSQIAAPDTMLTLAQHYTNPGDNIDHYMIFVLPSGFLQDKDASSVEFRPGNITNIIEAFIYQDTTGSFGVLDSINTGYGLEDSCHASFHLPQFLSYYNPGFSARKFPADIAEKIYAQSDFILAVHYAASPIQQVDSSWVNIFYSNNSTREVKLQKIDESYVLGSPVFIPANQQVTVKSEYQINMGDISLISISPQMHFLGKSMKIFAVTPFNDTIPLINIPYWIFNQRYLYKFEWLSKIDSGTILYTEGVFDNTTGNPNNPNNPPQNVYYGDCFPDEAFRYFFEWTPYEPGDEDLVLDSSLLTSVSPEISAVTGLPQLYSCAPNPSSTFMYVTFCLPEKETCTFSIIDVMGRLQQVTVFHKGSASGFQRVQFDVHEFPSGLYLIVLETPEGKAVKKFIKD
jgi:hypothetical protein